MSTTATAPLHTRHRSRKPSSLLNRLLKFPMAVRPPSLMHSGRSAFPKSTVSYLRVQYGSVRMFSLAPVAPAVNAKERAHVRQSVHQQYSVSGVLLWRHRRNAHAEYG